MENRRREERRANLLRGLNPRHIAVVGASRDPLSLGSRVLNNLQGAQSVLWIVDPRKGGCSARSVYGSLKDLPEAPDCLICAVPKKEVLPVLTEAASLDVGLAVLFTSGFAETGTSEGLAAEEGLRRICQTSAMRILGPNCSGFINNITRVHATFQYKPDIQGRGVVAIVSKSGIGLSVTQIVNSGGAFSHYASVGNACDVSLGDLFSWLAREPACQVVACVAEGLDKPADFLAGARALHQAGKPLVVYNYVTGQASAEAARLHTGAILKDAGVMCAVLDAAKAVSVASMQQLYETAAFFAKAGKPSAANGVAILTGSGGAGVMAVEQAAKHGVCLPSPSSEGLDKLRLRLPDFVSAGNPVDVSAQALRDRGLFLDCAGYLLDDPAFSLVAVPYPIARKQPVNRTAKALAGMARKSGKIVCLVWLSGWLQGPGSKFYERSSRIAVFRSVEGCFAAIAAWFKWHSQAQDEQGARSAVSGLPAVQPERNLSEEDCLRNTRAVLEDQGVRFAGQVTGSLDEVLASLAGLAPPLVLKAHMPDMPHKAQNGLIAMHVAGRAGVLEAARMITARLEKAGTDKPRKWSVQTMVDGSVELFLGARREADLGFVMALGLGGVFAENLGGKRFTLAPVGLAKARALIEDIMVPVRPRGARTLGLDITDVAAAAVAAFSSALYRLDPAIRAIEINPLILTGQEAIGVDLKIDRISG